MTTFNLPRTPGNDYATDLYQAKVYYGKMLDAYAATEAPDDDYLLKLSAIVGEVEEAWAAYVAMIDKRPDRVCL